MPPSGVVGKMDEDAIIEAEIAQQLEQIDVEVDDLADLNEEIDVEEDDQLGGDNPVLDDEEYIPPELVEYVQTIQKQTQKFERELEEVDDLLHHSDLLLNSSKEPYSNINRKLLEEAAEIAGEDPEEFRKRLLEDSKKDEDGDSDNDDELMTNTDTKDLVPILDESGEEVQNGEITSDPEDQKALVLVSENQLFFQQMMKREVEYMEKQRKEREERLEKELMEKKIIEEKEERQSEEKRLKIHHEIEKEKMELAQKQLVQKEKLEQEEKIKKEEIEKEIQNFEENIHKMEEEIQHEKEELTAIIKNEEEKNEHKQQEAAIKIQSRYRSYIVRREYKNMLDEKRIERKRRKEEARIKEVEQERKRIKREAEVERIKKEQEEKAKLEAEEKKKREEQEKIRQEEEEERNRKEQEELRKREEQERLKKEMEEKKKEQERLRLEEERKKKEEEKRIEEEKKQREEEKRKREEEERRQREEKERKLKEEEERKKKEEEQRIEEEQKREEEKRKLELQKEEERKRKEKETEKLQEENKEKSVEFMNNRESMKHELETMNKADLRKSNESIALRKLDKLGLRKSSEIKKSVEKEPHGKSGKDKISENNTAEDDLDDLLFGAEEKDTDRKVLSSHNVIEGLPENMDKKRIQWIKDCLPWSKISNEPWKMKLANKNKRSVRRPSSAKKLQLLEEVIITTAAKVETLRQVTTVQLQDLPGCNISTLGQCWGLKYLKMTNCNLVAVEGLQQCKQLQFVDFKDNYIEYIDLKDLGNLVYINLSKNKISSVHGLDGCTNVRWLNLSHNRITRLGGLEELRRLHTLDLSHNQLISTNGISATPTLQVLNLSQNHLQELEDIDKLCLLQHLDVTSNNLLKVPNLVNQVLLCSLLLEDNSISSIEEVTKLWLPLLYMLNLGQNSLEELVSFEDFHVLQEFNISNNQITESDHLLDCLCNCIYLETITVAGNPLEDSGLSSSLLKTFTRLQNLDGEVIRSHDTIQPMKTRNSFEAMCLTQMQIFKNCQQRFDQDLRNAENKQLLDLQNLCDIHFKFCDKTHKLAVEHRYAHEYGEISMAMPSAPSTPKTNRPKSSRARTIQKDEQQYMSPKEMFEKALQGGGDKGGNSSRQSDVHSVMSKNESEMKSPRKKITADLVGKMLQNGNKYTSAEEEAAIRIQAQWRGYSARKYFRNHINKAHNITDNKEDDNDFDMEVLQELHRAAVVIQSHWRGYSFRNRLMQALELAKFDDDDDDFEFEDVDMGEFNFDESMLEDWRPPDTPQLPSSHHAVLGKPPSGKQRSPPIKVPGLNLIETPQPPNLPRKAWRGMDSPLSDVHPPNRRVPRPPSSLANGSDTNRSVLSKKEEKITEEWGFKDSQTAHLMLQRAKKLKYNAARRKKLSKLDPKQRLALFRKLEEGTQPRTVYQQSRKTLPRKEYFQARQEEIERKDFEKRVEKSTKVNRTFEWIHTQVGNYDVSDSYIQHPQTTLKRVYGSDGNLPKLNPDITAGKPVRLVNSPVSMDLQSVDSASIHGDRIRSRRMSAGTEGSYTLPPIQASSAPSIRPKEKMSWRSPNVDQSVGWGGGKKRTLKR